MSPLHLKLLMPMPNWRGSTNAWGPAPRLHRRPESAPPCSLKMSKATLTFECWSECWPAGKGCLIVRQHGRTASIYLASRLGPPYRPMTVSFPEGAPCQEVVHRALLDIRSPEACCRLQPILCLTPDRISTLGFCVRKIPRPERRTSRFIAYACKALTGSPSTSYQAATSISSVSRPNNRASLCQSPSIWVSIRPFISLLVSSHLPPPWVLMN